MSSSWVYFFLKLNNPVVDDTTRNRAHAIAAYECPIGVGKAFATRNKARWRSLCNVPSSSLVSRHRNLPETWRIRCAHPRCKCSGRSYFRRWGSLFSPELRRQVAARFPVCRSPQTPPRPPETASSRAWASRTWPSNASCCRTPETCFVWKKKRSIVRVRYICVCVGMSYTQGVQYK